MIRRLSIYYFGGAVGALANSTLLWLVGEAGLMRALGVALSAKLTWPWISHRILWGGLWGLGFVLVANRFKPSRAGIVLSLAPSLAQLFYFFPQQGAGWLGVSHGALTPVVVLVANAVWGWVLGRVVAAGGGS